MTTLDDTKKCHFSVIILWLEIRSFLQTQLAVFDWLSNWQSCVTWFSRVFPRLATPVTVFASWVLIDSLMIWRCVSFVVIRLAWWGILLILLILATLSFSKLKVSILLTYYFHPSIFRYIVDEFRFSPHLYACSKFWWPIT